MCFQLSPPTSLRGGAARHACGSNSRRGAEGAGGELLPLKRRAAQRTACRAGQCQPREPHARRPRTCRRGVVCCVPIALAALEVIDAGHLLGGRGGREAGCLQGAGC